MMTRLRMGWFVAIALIAWACSSKSPAASGACAPNQSVSCNCPGTNSPGAQTCNADGSGYDKCVCSGAGSGGDATSTSTVATSTGSSPPTTSTMTGPPQASASGSGGASPFQGVCDMGGDCLTCQQSQCAEDHCANEISACQKDVQCKGIQTCIASCAANDPPCFNACIQMYPQGTSGLFALFSCTVCNPGPCYGDCMGASGCQMGMM